MARKNLIWICSESDLSNVNLSIFKYPFKTYIVTILERPEYNTLFQGMLSKELFEIFKKIMKYDTYSVQYVEHPVLREAAIIKLKDSPHKRIKCATDKDAFEKENEFYIGS